MSLPSFESMLKPVLELATRQDTARATISDYLADYFRLSEEDRAARIPSGTLTLRNRAGWAMTFLTKAGLIQKVAPKMYRATERGHQFLAAHAGGIAVSDLAAIEGWSEAWRRDADDDAPELDEEGQSPEAVETFVAWLVDRALPDTAVRRAVLEFLAWAIENADEERSDAWQLRIVGRRLELVVGRLLAFRLDRRGVGVSFVGPIDGGVRDTLGIQPEDEEEWRLVEGGRYVTLVPERAAAGLEGIKEAFGRFVDGAIGRLRRRVDLSDHALGAVAYLAKAVGRELPQPVLPQTPEDDEADDTDDENGEASRVPRIRGRPPIFELGQRAIGSLVEDVDPERGAIALPDLQRPFVWEDTKVRDLLDSLFIGFPVGTLVLWHTADERDARAVGAADAQLRATTLVIDGQQRLTSLYAVMRGREIEDRDGNKRTINIAFRPRDGRFEVADAAIKNDPEFLPNVTELWNGTRTKTQIRRDLLAALKDKGRIVNDAYEEAVDMNLERAQSIRDYRFPTVEIRKATASADVLEEDVADIFVRINNQGTRLGQADFVLTLLSVFHGGLRDRIEIRSREMSNSALVRIDTQQVLRTACAVAFGRARMSAIYRYLRGIDPVTGDANPERRRERLDALDRAADECLNATRWRDYNLRVLHAGFVTPSLVASVNAVTNAYAFYVLGYLRGVDKARLESAMSRWLFGSLLTARYSSSSESRYEEDLAKLRSVPEADPDAFLGVLDGLLADILTDDYWTRTLPAALETQRGRAPAALAFRAAQVVLGARGLFSDQSLRNLLASPGDGTRAASEMHHLFPKAWLQSRGISDKRRINQVANLADVGWHENSSVGSQRPSTYVPRLREKLGLGDDVWGRMCAEHALPTDWYEMAYDAFLAARRPRMAEIIRIAFRKLGGEAEASPLAPPWFLPGAEMVWQSIAEVERALRAAIRDTYVGRFREAAWQQIEAGLNERSRDGLHRAARNRPAGLDPLGLLDYLYLSQLPALLFRADVWPDARARLGGDPDAKRKLQTAVEHIVPVRNEIAHVREVAPERLQRASLACSDVLAMLRSAH